MFQIDNSTAAGTQPPSTPAGTAGFFTDGNPASNQPATIVPAEWLNSMMMELVNAVTGSGQTLNKAAFNQLWTAMQTIAKNPGVTPPQFDNTTKTATTAFVKTALGSFSDAPILNAATVLTAANIGKLHICAAGSGAVTMTLPPSAGIPTGSFIGFTNGNAGVVTLAPQGSDSLWFSGGASGNQKLAQGDSAFLVYQGGGVWQTYGGSTQLGSSTGVFGASIANNGFQRLPGGMLLQWGLTGASVVGGSSVYFPVAFPHALLAVVLGGPTSGPAFATVGNTSQNASGFPYAVWNNTNAAVAGIGSSYVAMGY
ncbi:hypothetical protein [Paraburkholderia sp. EG304]|uniref:gp53-like domain-containing protein n=1 Tax=Paraburkholderia sp. EG304 TaxID=3237015 RepID=UPI003978D31F